MTDTVLQGVLRGFDISVADIGHSIRFCRPLVSLGDDHDTVYVTEEPNWGEPGALVRTDIADAKMLATVLPEHPPRHVSPPQGVVVAGRGFVEAARSAGIDLSWCHDDIESGCRMGLISPDDYRRFRDSIVKQARDVFDEELKHSVLEKASLSERGRAAILLLRESAPCDEELAVRQLASAVLDDAPSVYQRLRTGFALELDMRGIEVQRRVIYYMAKTCAERQVQYIWKMQPHMSSDESRQEMLAKPHFPSRAIALGHKMSSRRPNALLDSGKTAASKPQTVLSQPLWDIFEVKSAPAEVAWSHNLKDTRSSARTEVA